MSLTFSVSPARCVECMACVRVCPVEAVQAQDGTVRIVEESCIECGLCVPACQHDAIDTAGDIELGRRYVAEGGAVLILANEAFVHFHPVTPEQLLNAAYAAGFREVYVSALGDELVAREYLRLWQRADGRTTIRSTSPVVVEYIQRNHPELLRYLAPVVTPAVAEARYLRALHGEGVHIIYCGVASPGTTEEARDGIDACVTFDELEWLLVERGATPAEQPMQLLQEVPERRRHLSTAGGMPLPVLAAERKTSRRFREVRGLDQVPAIAEAISRRDGERLGFIDLLPYEGELDHPAMGPKEQLYWRREVAERAEPPRSPMPVVDPRVRVDLFVGREPTPHAEALSREEIDGLIDVEIGRASSGAYWDCGGCGFKGCVEFASAVLRGRARLDICPFYQARRYEQALRDAAHDALTELYSYRVLKGRLHEEIARVDRTGTSAAILFIDIDEFKPVNDRLGHPAGNEVLRQVAAAIRKSIRGSDIAARYGGDEFVIILTEADRHGALRVAEEIRWRASQIKARGAAGEMPVSVSIGIAGVRPNGDGAGEPEGDVLAAADMALLAAKRAGGNAIRLYAGSEGGAVEEEPETRRTRTEDSGTRGEEMIEPQRKSPADAHEPAWLRRAEELLRGLTGVVSTRIVADAAGHIEEIHVLTDHTVEPKQTVRNVESALLAELGMRIDHRKVSVAQARHPEEVTVLDLGRPPEPEEGQRRYLFVGYEFERKYVHRVECRVRVRCGDEEYEGTAEGADIENARLTVAAQAVLEALEMAEDHEIAFALDGARVVDLFDRPVVVVGVYGLSGRSRTFLAGAVPVRESAEHAAILAALQATNRWITTRGVQL